MLLVVCLLSGCGADELAKAVDLSTLQKKNGLQYLPNTDHPYTGWVKKHFGDSEKINELRKFKNGKRDGEFTVLARKRTDSD